MGWPVCHSYSAAEGFTMKLLVTGATGFIGNHFVRQALRQGHEITVITRDKSVVLESDWGNQVVIIETDIETICLGINSDKARKHLDWKPVWDFNKATETTALWYRKLAEDGRVDTAKQWQHYIDDANKAGVCWS